MTVDEKKLRYMEYIHREKGIRHHTNTEDMRQYEMLRSGDPGTVEEAVRIFASDLPGHVSNDPVRNCKYLFVASVTMACRTALAAGVEQERVYNSSDLFILRMDELDSIEAACNMLKFSDYSCADVGVILAFSSQSRFIRAFKTRTGQTPRAYREKYFEV